MSLSSLCGAATTRAIRRPLWTLLVFTLAAALGAAGASRLEFQSDYAALLPEDAPEVRDLRVVSQQVGVAWFVIVAVDLHSSGLSNPAERLTQGKRWSLALGQHLEQHPELEFVDVRLPLDFIEARALLYLTPPQLEQVTAEVRRQIDWAKYQAHPLHLDLGEDAKPPAGSSLREIERKMRTETPFPEYQLSPDGRTLYLFARPAFPPTEIERSRRLFRDLEQEISAFSQARGERLKTQFGGAHYSHLVEDDEINRDLRSASGWAAALIVVVTLLLTRRKRAIPLVVAPLVGALSMTFGFAFVVFGHINIVTGFLVAILFGVGIDYGLHMYQRYVEERRERRPADAALIHAARHTGRATFTSAITTAVAFLTLCLTDFKGFSEFGLLAAVGVVLALVATFFVLPALAVLFEKRWPLVVPTSLSQTSKRNVPRRLALLVVLSAALASAAAVWTLRYVEFEHDLDELRAEGPGLSFERQLDKTLGGQVTPALILVNAAAEPSARTALQELPADVAVSRVLSLQDLVPSNQAQKLPQIRQLARLLADPLLERAPAEEQASLRRARALAKVAAFTEDDLPTTLRRRFDAGEGWALLIAQPQTVPSIDAMMRWTRSMDGIRSRLQAQGHEVHIVSGSSLAGKLFSLVIGDGPFVLWATLLAVGGVLLLDFRSLRRALWAFLPVVLSLVWIGGAMATLGFKLNIFNALLFPSLIGLGVDASVHICQRYRELGPGSLLRVLSGTGRAVVAALLTTAVGFGSTALAHHRGIASLGSLAILGLGLCAVSCLVVLPCALRLTERER